MVPVTVPVRVFSRFSEFPSEQHLSELLIILLNGAYAAVMWGLRSKVFRLLVSFQVCSLFLIPKSIKLELNISKIRHPVAKPCIITDQIADLLYKVIELFVIYLTWSCPKFGIDERLSLAV